MIGADVIRRLTALRYLGISSDMDVQELMLLNMLEHLVGHFHDISKFLAFIEHMEIARSRLAAYVLTLGHQYVDSIDEINYFAEKCVCFGDRIMKDGAGTCGSKFPKLPSDIQLLIIRPNGDVISLCELLSSPLHNLEHLTLESMFNLQSLFGDGRGAELSFYSASFSNLKSLIIFRCDNLKKLFPEEVSINLRNVEVSLEEMVGAENGESVESEESKSLAEFSLPSLKFLELIDLLNLKSLCRHNQVIHFASLQGITILGCPVLKRMPFDLHSQHRPFSRFRFQDGEETWVQCLEWDPPNSKSLMSFDKIEWFGK